MALVISIFRLIVILNISVDFLRSTNPFVSQIYCFLSHVSRFSHWEKFLKAEKFRNRLLYLDGSELSYSLKLIFVKSSFSSFVKVCMYILLGTLEKVEKQIKIFKLIIYQIKTKKSFMMFFWLVQTSGV